MRLLNLYKIFRLILAPIWFELYNNALFCARLDLHTAGAKSVALDERARLSADFY